MAVKLAFKMLISSISSTLQEPIAQILYDETYHKYIIVEDYNADISRHLADTYSYYMNNVGTELEKDSYSQV